MLLRDGDLGATDDRLAVAFNGLGHYVVTIGCVGIIMSMPMPMLAGMPIRVIVLVCDGQDVGMERLVPVVVDHQASTGADIEEQ